MHITQSDHVEMYLCNISKETVDLRSYERVANA